MSVDMPLNTESNDMIILTWNSLSKNFLRLNNVIRVNYSFLNFLRMVINIVICTCYDTSLLKFNKKIKKNVTYSLFGLKMIFYDQTKNTSPLSNGNSKSNFFFKFRFYVTQM